MSAPDLLPCPFCGDDKVASFARTCDRHTPYNPADRTYPVVRCSCGVEVPGANWSEPETAIATWNKRAPTAPQGAEIARELGDLLAHIHRDGGHYQDEHGLAKACEDAHEKVTRWLARDEAALTPTDAETKG